MRRAVTGTPRKRLRRIRRTWRRRRRPRRWWWRTWRRTRRRRFRRRQCGRRRRHASEAAGFGVRVIHSGVWGFASSPIVTEDEIRRITRMASEVAKASAIAKKVDVRLAPVPAYTDYWATPMVKDPAKIAQTEKQALVQKVVDLAVANKEVLTVNASRPARGTNGSTSLRREGSYIEQEVYTTTPSLQCDGAQERRDAVAQLHRRARHRRLGDRRSGRHGRERRADRRRGSRVLHRQAGRDGAEGPDPHAVARDADDPRDRRARHRARSHHGLRGELRRHQLREDLRPRQAEIRIEAVQRHRRPDDPDRRRHRRL